jgi:hypothetical protein
MKTALKWIFSLLLMANFCLVHASDMQFRMRRNGIGISMSPYYQQGPGGMRKGRMNERAQERMDELTAKLKLTSSQQEKVKLIMKQTRLEAKNIIENYTTPETRRPKMMELAKKTDTQINLILDPSQQELYKQYKAEQKKKRHEQMKEQKEMRMEMDDAGIL